MRVNVASYRPRRWLSNAVPKALFVMAVSTFLSTAAVSGFDEGVASYRSGNYAAAFKEWTEAAQQGDVDAQVQSWMPLYSRRRRAPEDCAWGAGLASTGSRSG